MALIDRLKNTKLVSNPGQKPKAPRSIGGDPIRVNNTFSKGEYSLYVLDTESVIEKSRAQDSTAFGLGNRS